MENVSNYNPLAIRCNQLIYHSLQLICLSSNQIVVVFFLNVMQLNCEQSCRLVGSHFYIWKNWKLFQNQQQLQRFLYLPTCSLCSLLALICLCSPWLESFFDLSSLLSFQCSRTFPECRYSLCAHKGWRKKSRDLHRLSWGLHLGLPIRVGYMFLSLLQFQIAVSENSVRMMMSVLLSSRGRLLICFFYVDCSISNCSLWKFNKDDDISAFELQRQITYLFLLCGLLRTYTVSILLSVYFCFFCHSIQALQFQELEWVVLGAFSCPEYSKTGSAAVHAKRVGFFVSVLIIGTNCMKLPMLPVF